MNKYQKIWFRRRISKQSDSEGSRVWKIRFWRVKSGLKVFWTSLGGDRNRDMGGRILSRCQTRPGRPMGPNARAGGRDFRAGGRADMIFPGLYSGKSESPSQKIQILPQLAPITTGEDHIQGKRHAALRRRTLGPRGTCWITNFLDFFKKKSRKILNF